MASQAVWKASDHECSMKNRKNSFPLEKKSRCFKKWQIIQLDSDTEKLGAIIKKNILKY